MKKNDISESFSHGFNIIEDSAILMQFRRNLQCLTGLPFDFLSLTARHSTRMQVIYTSLCQYVNSSPGGRAACKESTEEAVRECLRTREKVVRTCHLGLIDVYVPLVIREKIVGILASGQLLLDKPTERSFAKVAEKLELLDLDPARARASYFSVPSFSREQLSAIVGLMSVITQHANVVDDWLLALSEVDQKGHIERAQEFLEHHYYHEKLRLADVATAVHLSESRVSHLFRQKLRTTVIGYLNGIRLEKATLLLDTTSLSIGEIAGRVGFACISHFNHLFKEKFGRSPSSYKKRQDRTSN